MTFNLTSGASTNTEFKSVVITYSSSSGYTITNANPTGGSITVASSAEENDNVAISATPNAGYNFTSWNIYKTGDQSTTITPAAATASTSFTMPAYPVTVDANFAAIDYVITHNAATNGTYTIQVGDIAAVNTNTTANVGQTITLAASPSDGYALTAWNVTETVSGDAVTVTDNQFTMPAAAVTIAPTFAVSSDATITWAFDKGTDTDANKTASASIDYFKSSTVTLGSSLSYAGQQELKLANASLDPKQYSTKIQMPSSSQSSASDANAIIFKITPKSGVTFTPTRVSFRATRCGTNGGKMTMTWISAGNDDVALGTSSATSSNTDPARDNNETQNWTVYDYDLTAKGASATTGEFGLKINLYNQIKQYAYSNIVIEGTYSGTPSAATHNVTVSVADGQSTYGAVSPAGDEGVTTVDDGDNLTITATPNTAYKFQKWVIDGDTEVTTNPYTISDITADHTAVAHFEARKAISYTGLTTAIRGTVTTNYGVEYANDADKFTAPANKYLSDDGKTLTAWKDANEVSYTPGTEYTLTDDIVLTPVFTTNADGSLPTILSNNMGNVDVTWQFGVSYADFNVEGKTSYYTQQATINGNSVDVPMYINATSGKVNNEGRNDALAQTNGGTVFTVPVKNGAVIVMNTSYEFNKTSGSTLINGSTDYELSNSNKTATYTYSGSAESINITVGSDIRYTESIAVTYPSAKPAIFNYADGKTISQLEAAGWEFNSAEYGADPKDTEAYVNLVSAMNAKGLAAPKTSGMADNAIAFAKNPDVYAQYDFGSTVTVSDVKGTFLIGSSSAKSFNITLLGSDGTTVKATINVSNPASNNWGAATVAAIASPVADVRYLKINGMSSSPAWIVMNDLFVDYSNTVTVGAKGYATYCNSETALDFTGKSIKAYTISSEDGNALTLTNVNKVAKNTPLLLYSETNSDSQSIPAIADSETMDATTGNKLVAGDGNAHTWVENSTEHYILYTGGTTPGFYRANNSNVAIGKAYLDLTGVTGGARAFSFDLNLGEGETTGIANANVNHNANDNYYNLAGQRVAQPTKGLYIVNGKKVVIK